MKMDFSLIFGPLSRAVTYKIYNLGLNRFYLFSILFLKAPDKQINPV